MIFKQRTTLFFIFFLLIILTSSKAHAFGMLESVVTDIAKKQAVNVIAQNLIEEMVREEFRKSGIPFNHYDIETVVSAVKTNLGGNLTREDIPRITLAITRIMHETDRAKKQKMEQQQAAEKLRQQQPQQAQAVQATSVALTGQPQAIAPHPTSSTTETTEVAQLRAEMRQIIVRMDELERKLEVAQEYSTDPRTSPAAGVLQPQADSYQRTDQFTSAQTRNEEVQATNEVQGRGVVDKGGYLGVNYRLVDSSIAKVSGLRETFGVIIEKVINNSPASRASLAIGDLLLRINGTTLFDLGEHVSMLEPGTVVVFDIIRDKHLMKVPVTIAARPAGFK